ncbi:MAG: DoxX family protein [Balneolales bacterium]
MDTRAITLGRILFGIPFALFGLLHFMNAGDMTGVVPAWIPGGIFWVYVTGIGLLTGGVSIVINQYTRTGGYIIATLMIIFVLTVHLPGLFNEQTMQMAMTSFLKDLALGGGALVLAGLSPDETVSGSEI